MKPTELPKAIIVDVDGTLAHMVNRSPYDPTKYDTDIIDETIRDMVNLYYDEGYEVIVCSGRDDTYIDVTENWLIENGLHWHTTLMRKANDKREDSIIKQEIFENNIKGKYDIKFVLDDRNRVVNMWRANGLKCLQVAEGNF